MSDDWLLTLAPVFGLTGNVLAQIVFARAVRRVGASIVAGLLTGLAVTASAAALSNQEGRALERVAEWAVALLTYAALGFGYWAFLNLNITSLRIRMLREILHCPGGISRTELTARYSAEELLQRRLQRLEQAGQMTCRDGIWRLNSPTLLALARTMTMLRAFILPRSARQRDL